MVDAVRSSNASAFNDSISKYRAELEKFSVAKSAMPKAEFEAWYNRFGAFNGCIAFYIIASVLAFFSMIVAPQTLRRTAFWIAVTVFVVHLAAIIARIYITGSRAGHQPLFFGGLHWLRCRLIRIDPGGIVPDSDWAAGRYHYRQYESLGGLRSGYQRYDAVLQAVLDTQFWLTTHVQCITAGYLATFVAGGLAIGAILHRAVHRNELSGPTPRANVTEVQRILYRVTYGTALLCHLLSLIGTVLGGLWADDSWGRFWGWDRRRTGR